MSQIIHCYWGSCYFESHIIISVRMSSKLEKIWCQGWDRGEGFFLDWITRQWMCLINLQWFQTLYRPLHSDFLWWRFPINIESNWEQIRLRRRLRALRLFKCLRLKQPSYYILCSEFSFINRPSRMTQPSSPLLPSALFLSSYWGPGSPLHFPTSSSFAPTLLCPSLLNPLFHSKGNRPDQYTPPAPRRYTWSCPSLDCLSLELECLPLSPSHTRFQTLCLCKL